MAYGNYSKATWWKVWTNGKYGIYLLGSVAIDGVQNKSKVRIQEMRITALDEFHNFKNTVNYAVATNTKAKTKSKYIEVKSAKKISGGYDYFPTDINTTDVILEQSHDSKGNPPATVNIYFYFDTNLDIAGYDLPNIGWKSYNVSSKIGNISRETGITTTELINTTYNSATIEVTADTYSSEGRYRLGKGTWRDMPITSDLQKVNGGTMTYVVTGLKPNSAYKIEAQCRRAFNGLWNRSNAVDAPTKKPFAPIAGTLEAIEVGSNFVKIEATNWRFSEGATWGYYEYQINSKWYRIEEKSDTFIIDGLNPNQLYFIVVRLVDNYGTASDTVSISFKTNSVFKEVLVNYNGNVVRGRIIGNVNGINYNAKEIIGQVDGIKYKVKE